MMNWTRPMKDSKLVACKISGSRAGSIRFTSPTGWMVIRAAGRQTGVRPSGEYGSTQISSGGYRHAESRRPHW